VTSIIIHGHFYQPPRENPWSGALDREDSARPAHDWNERIYGECYRPNAFARIVNGKGQIERIVNNYANLSFNFGPTLMRWLEVAHPDTNARIIAADQLSRERHNGHGGAIAQAYNHAILPLCNERDLRTQIKWGIADFHYRFGREPEALWLPETACNDKVMSALIEAGMKYVILSPHQAERVRSLEPRDQNGQWNSVAEGSIDPRKPYKYFHRDGSGRSLAVFFYDDGIARAVAFENLLWSSEALLDRLISGAAGGAMVNVATDGESYGHHYKFGDRCIAYALEVEAHRRGLEVTNYGDFLARNPPLDEVEIKAGPDDEGTAWSCVHGVGRWYRNCGCHTGGEPGWNQEWRTPLRAAFDLLRDECARGFEEQGARLFRDPWKARDDFIEVVLHRTAAHENFLARHARRKIDDEARLRALTLLELQRNAMLMYTSCGWFFSELSGIETVQTMKYADHAMDLMESLGIAAPRERFLELLAQAKSNLAAMGNGADVFRRLVAPSRVTPIRIAAHLAISRLADHAGHPHHPADHPDRADRELWIGDYSCREEDLRQQKNGRITLATSRVMLRNSIVGKREDFACAALHLGGVDFYCALQNYESMLDYRGANEKVWSKFPGAPLPALIRVVQEKFGNEEFALEDILSDGRLVICEMIFGDLLEGFTDEFAHLYQEYNRVVEMLQASGFEPPAQFQKLIEFTLGRRFESEIARQQGSHDPSTYKSAIEIAILASNRGYAIEKAPANESFSAMINEAVSKAVERPSRTAANTALDLIALARRLNLEPNLELAQERIYQAVVTVSQQGGQLARLAGAVGLAHSAARRPRPATSRTPHQDGVAPTRGRHNDKPRRGHPRPRPA
jgi:alpha-amylase/alpha-mannosidase (GH57 family)